MNGHPPRHGMLATCLALCLFVMACPRGMTGIAWGQTTYRFAVTDVADMATIAADWSPFAARFQELVGDVLTFVPMPRRDSIIQALEDREVDVALSGPAEYVVIRKRTDASLLLGFSRPGYFSVIATLAKGGVQRLGDLKGRRLGLSARGSTSGHLGPLQILKDGGLNPLRDVQVVHTSTAQAWEALKRGDVAAVGLSHSGYLALLEKEAAGSPGVRTLARGKDLPGDLLLLGAHVPAEQGERLRRALLEHAQEFIAAIAATPGNAKYRDMQFLPASRDEDYNGIREMYATAGYPAYAEFID